MRECYDRDMQSIESRAISALQTIRATRSKDQCVVLRGVDWALYQRLDELRGQDVPWPRLIYCDGALELVTHSVDHEKLKKVIARLIEAYAGRRGKSLNGAGHATLSDPLVRRGLEPDECYYLGPVGRRKRPDLAIEVIWTHGGLNKLEVYRPLRVKEVWMWKKGRIQVFVLRSRQYRAASRSRLLPDLDLDHLLSFVDLDHQTEAVERYRRALRRRR